MWRNYHFEIVGEESDLCGEEFFVAVPEYEKCYEEAWKCAQGNFPDETLKCWGWVDDDEAEMMGLDTY